MTEQSALYMLNDIIFTLLERGELAKESYRRAKEADADEGEIKYWLGVTQTYYMVLDTLIRQINTFGLVVDVPIASKVDPDKLLEDVLAM